MSIEHRALLRRILTPSGAVLAAAITLLAGCAGVPSAPAAESAQAATQAGSGSQAAQSSTDASSFAPSQQLSGPSAWFVDAKGDRVNGQDTAVTLPTGAPPSGRLFPRSDATQATLFVTIDGTVPTADNNWASFKPGETHRYISSLEAKTRTYRIVAMTDSGSAGPVSTCVVSWSDEQKPALEPPRFVAGGKELAPAAAVTLPTGGDKNRTGRLSLTCNYLGATLYITNDGSDPSPKNFWKSGICDGTYIYSANAFTATYKAIAVLRGSQSGVTEAKVSWMSQ